MMQPKNTEQLLTQHFRCPKDIADIAVTADPSDGSDYFRFGSRDICYGEGCGRIPAIRERDSEHVSSQCSHTTGSTVQLPFDPVQFVENLRFERYAANSTQGKSKLTTNNVVRNIYYLGRPFLPVVMRKHFQQIYLRGWKKLPFPTWPVDRTVENIIEQLLVFAMRTRKISKLPFIWFWPEGARSCAIMTHDVETSSGAAFCPQLMDLNDSLGIKASFQIVPEKRYPVTSHFLESIRRRGFEVNVHDLNHDGRLFNNRTEFLHRAERINRYAQQFGALGFRSAVLYRNLDWYDALDFSYDMSVPNVAHLDPQRGGCCTILPFFVGKILELPVTTIQDYSLFHVLNDYSTRLWRQQISLILEKHGLISFIVHPDYITGDAARRVYAALLYHLSELRSRGETWIALPSEVETWWRLRSELNLVNVGGSWHIEGKGSERARIASAVLVNDTLTYEIDRPSA
jgi:hypothetical protein